MLTKQELAQTLEKIDNKSYKAYKKLQHKWYDFGNYQLGIPYVQGDPYATPSQVFIRIDAATANFPDWTLQNNIRQIATEDYLIRKLDQSIQQVVKGHRGSGASGKVSIVNTGQEALARTAIDFNQARIEVRLRVGLPAKGRTILAQQAEEIFLTELPQLVADNLFYHKLNKANFKEHILTIEDQQILRRRLKAKNLISFIANDAILPRKSGRNDKPLTNTQVVPFQSSDSLEVEFDLPYHGKITGLGIPEGITLIVGGGYHGKSTLLQAIERGIYNHIPNDGRELVVTRPNALKIRAEDGRQIERVDISPFITNLPQEIDTSFFSTPDASGSTSQAANIVEGLELGSKTLLIDEDTSATNFMIRDVRMQQLIANEQEPITPLIDQVKDLYQDHDVSTVLVVGGAGDYFDIADQVIMMQNYLPYDVTAKARKIAQEYPSQRSLENDTNFNTVGRRYPNPASIDPEYKGKIKVKAHDREKLKFGREEINLSRLEQLLSREETQTIGDLIVYALQEDIINQETPLADSLEELDNILDNKGLEVISPFSAPQDNYVRPRMMEVGATLNRLRSLEITKIIEDI
ncbi:ABC-ATPase domain-containing protein [Halanaerobaculum tunisiense]